MPHILRFSMVFLKMHFSDIPLLFLSLSATLNEGSSIRDHSALTLFDEAWKSDYLSITVSIGSSRIADSCYFVKLMSSDHFSRVAEISHVS